jgi:hypothetical protein
VVYVKEPMKQAEGYASTYLRDKEDGSQDDLLRRLVRWFEESEEASRESREKAERDQDYYDNKQLTQDDVNKLNDRGQPPIAINLIRRKVDTLRGMEVKQRSDPKAWPRTPADADHAEIATDTLRYVFDSAKYNTKVRKWVFKDILIPGWGGVQLQLVNENRIDRISRALGSKPNKRLVWKRTPWDRMFWDPHSAEHVSIAVSCCGRTRARRWICTGMTRMPGASSRPLSRATALARLLTTSPAASGSMRAASAFASCKSGGRRWAT